jgi:hypothetical protein
MEKKDKNQKDPIVMSVSQLIAALRQKRYSTETDQADLFTVPVSSDASFCYFCSRRCPTAGRDNTHCRDEFLKLMETSLRLDA